MAGLNRCDPSLATEVEVLSSSSNVQEQIHPKLLLMLSLDVITET